MPSYARIGSLLILAASTSLVGCGNSDPAVFTEEAKSDAPAVNPAPAPARGKAAPKFIPRSEGKR